jgi:hypothetical protein
MTIATITWQADQAFTQSQREASADEALATMIYRTDGALVALTTEFETRPDLEALRQALEHLFSAGGRTVGFTVRFPDQSSLTYAAGDLQSFRPKNTA